MSAGDNDASKCNEEVKNLREYRRGWWIRSQDVTVLCDGCSAKLRVKFLQLCLNDERIGGDFEEEVGIDEWVRRRRAFWLFEER